MSSWELASVLIPGLIPFFLHRQTVKLQEKIDDTIGIFKIFIFFVSMFLYVIVLRLGVLIAELHNSVITELLNTVFLSWLTIVSVLLFLTIFIYIPYRLFKAKNEEQERLQTH